jgi:hypothetical protein
VAHPVIRCAKRHCRCDNNSIDTRGSRDLQKICLPQRNLYFKEKLRLDTLDIQI